MGGELDNLYDHNTTMVFGCNEVDQKARDAMLTNKGDSHIFFDSWIFDMRLHGSEPEDESHNGSSNLPHPKPYFDRATNQNKSSIQPSILTRARSSSPHREKNIWSTTNRSASLPNLLSSRSTHNRSLGQLLLSDHLGRTGSQVTPMKHSRIEEFDALLENL